MVHESRRGGSCGHAREPAKGRLTPSFAEPPSHSAEDPWLHVAEEASKDTKDLRGYQTWPLEAARAIQRDGSETCPSEWGPTRLVRAACPIALKRIADVWVLNPDDEGRAHAEGITPVWAGKARGPRGDSDAVVG
jgi:hypothetical protein